MEDHDFLNMIGNGESTSVEFKESLPEPRRKIAHEMAAFANSEGGVILVGVLDNGVVCGVTDPDQVIRDVANLARDAVKPALNPQIRRVTITNHTLVAIEIQRTILPRQVDGKHYLRVGTTVREATSEEIAALYTNRPKLSDFLLSFDAYFATFNPRNIQGHEPDQSSTAEHSDEWQRLENMRVKVYQEGEGLFLTHRWKPSSLPGQVADISIRLCQHRDGPLSRQEVETVEYQLGPMFFTDRVVVQDSTEDFRLDVSAYAPMLCLAKVSFKTSRPPLYLTRYIDFG